MVAKVDAASGLPALGNRNTNSFRDADWELSGRRNGSTIRCTAEKLGSGLRLGCKSEAGFSCVAELELTSGN